MKLKDFFAQIQKLELDPDTEIGKGSLVDGKWEFDSDILIRHCNSVDFINTDSSKKIIVIF